MKKWILAVYAGEDKARAELYRAAFEANGFGWESRLTENTLLLADAVLFICSRGLFEEEAAADAFRMCLRRDIPVILAEKSCAEDLPAYPEDAEVYDAVEISFDSLREKLEKESLPAPEKPENSRRINRFSVFLALLAFIGVIFLLIRISPPLMPAPAEETAAETDKTERFGDAVVQVWSIGSFGNRVYRGSGFAVASTGEIVTNAHVVNHPASRYCIVYMDHVYNAEVAAVSEETDLALLKADLTIRHTLSFAAEKPGKNTPVYIIGYPESEGKTVTAGVYDGTVFAAGETEYEVILAGLRQGNSGSPVCANDGKVVGVASAVSAENEEIGLMIPAEDCIAFLKDLVFLPESR